MDKRLWNALNDLLDEAEYALKVLDNYQDFEDDPFNFQSSPNAAMIAHSGLSAAIKHIEKLMPDNPEAALERATSRAEYMEDR